MRVSNPFRPNFTIVVNWKPKGFGCAKACSYCNWRDSSLLPQGAQSTQAVLAFIRQCKKSFITISGGGDPLYKIEENLPALLAMIDTIRAGGFKVRIITREIQHVAKLKGIADYVSISLDDDGLAELGNYSEQWQGMDLEYSLVLPPLPIDRLVVLKPQYMALRSKLNKRLVLRENFNSIFPLDPSVMSFGHKGIVIVPKALCLESRYLSTIECSGHAIVQDNAALAKFLMGHPAAFLFGGFVKHLVDPVVHLEYGDIDVIATDPAIMANLTDRFDYQFKEVSPAGSYPRYFLGKSVRAGKTIQLILMHSEADAKEFIFNAQYTVDRFGYNRGLFFDPSIGEAIIREAIHNKTICDASGRRSLMLFQPNRDRVEQRHKFKLLKKGFTPTTNAVTV
jgi:hypothetical protein